MAAGFKACYPTERSEFISDAEQHDTKMIHYYLITYCISPPPLPHIAGGSGKESVGGGRQLDSVVHRRPQQLAAMLEALNGGEGVRA